jgi:hypothetical protein
MSTGLEGGSANRRGHGDLPSHWRVENSSSNRSPSQAFEDLDLGLGEPARVLQD